MASIKRKAINQMLVEPEELGTIFTSLYNIMTQESKQNILIEVFQDITTNIIIPIITTSAEEIEDRFNRYITPFQSQLKKLIDIIKDNRLNKNHLQSFNISDIENFSNDFYIMIENDFRNESFLKEVSYTLKVYNEYSKTLLKNDIEKPDILDNVLSYRIDMNDLQKYVSGSILAFYCILFCISNRQETERLLPIVLKISEKYNHNLLNYVKTIDILCNRERIEEIKELIHTNAVVAEIIGKSLVADIPLEFKVQNIGRFIAINYNGSIVAKSDTLEGLHNEIDKKGIENDCYIDRIGYNTIAKIDL